MGVAPAIAEGLRLAAFEGEGHVCGGPQQAAGIIAAVDARHDGVGARVEGLLRQGEVAFASPVEGRRDRLAVDPDLGLLVQLAQAKM